MPNGKLGDTSLDPTGSSGHWKVSCLQLAVQVAAVSKQFKDCPFQSALGFFFSENMGTPLFVRKHGVLCPRDF